MLVLSCSVKERRWDCPCYLNTELQAHHFVTLSGDAIVSVWSDDGKLLDEQVVAGEQVDTTVTSVIYPRQDVCVTVANSRTVDGRVVSDDTTFPRLSVYKVQASCRADQVSVASYSATKEWSTFTFILNDNALPLYRELALEVVSPYDGLTLSTGEPHKGEKRYSLHFNEDGEAVVSLCRQAGKGLRIVLRRNGGVPASYDLYSLTASAGLDWSKDNLDDFTCCIGLNELTNTIEMVDWELYNYEHIIF